MPKQTRYRFLVPLCLFVATLPATALELRSGDSLNVTLAGAGGGQYHEPSGVKGFVSGLVYASFWHPFSERIVAEVSVRGAESSTQPFIHQGYVGWRGERLALDGGFVAERYGSVRFHRARDFLAATFDSPLIIDIHQLGVRARSTFGALTVTASAGINNRESGAALLRAGLARAAWDVSALGAIQTYDSWTQDNVVTAGVQSAYHNETFGLQAIGVYRRYMGYGGATNVTMVPGWGVDLCAEGAVSPIRQLRFSALARYERSERLVEREIVSGGAELEAFALNWFGAGAGIELRYESGLLTWAPSVIADIRPMPGQAEIRIRAERRQTGSSSPTWTVSGAVWIDI